VLWRKSQGFRLSLQPCSLDLQSSTGWLHRGSLQCLSLINDVAALSLTASKVLAYYLNEEKDDDEYNLFPTTKYNQPSWSSLWLFWVLDSAEFCQMFFFRNLMVSWEKWCYFCFCFCRRKQTKTEDHSSSGVYSLFLVISSVCLGMICWITSAWTGNSSRLHVSDEL